MRKFHSRNPEPKAAALLRIARTTLRIPLTTVGRVVGRNWATVNNAEAGAYRLSPAIEDKVLRFYVAEFAARGTQVEEIPDGASLAELRVVLAKALFTVQSEGLLAQSAGLEQAATGLGRGATDFVEQVVGAGLRNFGVPPVTARLLKKISEAEESPTAAAGNE